MIVCIYILLSIFLTLFVKKKYLCTYFLISVIGLSGIYLWCKPFESDLSRIYDLMDIYKNIAISDILSLGGGYNYGSVLVNDYIASYPIFSIMAYFFAKFPIKELLPFSVGLFTYIPPILVIKEFAQKLSLDKWKIVACYIFIVCNLDFLSINGIRNSLAAAIFFYAFYIEIYKSGNKIICYVIYFMTCLIHSFGVVLLALRIMVLIYCSSVKTIARIIIMFIILSIPTLMGQLSAMNFGGVVGVILRRVSLLYGLYEGRTEAYGYHMQYIIAISGFIVLLLMSFLSIKYAKKENEMITVFLAGLIIFSLSNIDTFTARSKFMYYPLSMITFIQFLNQIGTSKFHKFKKFGFYSLKNNIVLVLTYMEVLIMFTLNVIFRYNVIDLWMGKNL